MQNLRFDQSYWFSQGRGPKYLQLTNYIAEAVRSGNVIPGSQLPTERDLAQIAGVSRVTVRKALKDLVEQGIIEQRQGAGTFVKGGRSPVAQSLSAISSFSETLAVQGMTSTNDVIRSGVDRPDSDEMLRLGMPISGRVTRILRLRRADGMPIALEQASLPNDILPDPREVVGSLYAVLRRRNCAPVRAIQNISAENVSEEDAALLEVEPGTALLRVIRTGYLSSGRPVEYTRGLYRPDIYDFVTEVHSTALETGLQQWQLAGQ